MSQHACSGAQQQRQRSKLVLGAEAHSSAEFCDAPCADAFTSFLDDAGIPDPDSLSVKRSDCDTIFIVCK